MNRKLLLSILLLLVITMTACSGTESEPEQQTTDEAIIQNQDSEYPMQFDNYGREVTITQKPTKVLALGPNCTELFVALGLEDYVIGRSLVNHSRGPLPEYEEAVNGIDILNYAEATREAILTSGCDFIYAIDWEISDVGCNIEEAESYGIDVYVNSATTLEEQYKEIEDIGKIFGVEEKATEFINDQKSRISKVQQEVQDEEIVDVLVYDSGNSGVFTCSGNNFESLLISLAGGRNIFDDITDKQWITVSYEDILQRNPDVILIHDYDTPSVDEKIAEIKANPVLSQLDCVKNDRFVILPLESVLPGDRMADTVEQLAYGFHNVE